MDNSGNPPPYPQAGNEPTPSLPPRPHDEGFPVYNPADYADKPTGSQQAFAPPPGRRSQETNQDINSPIHYTRDPHKLVAYLVPFPKPHLPGVAAENIPPRFLIYTPPPPPLSKPAEGEKESKVHKVQRKWQEEIREAKTSNAKTSNAKTISWKGIKGKVTKGINWGMSQTKNSNLEFLNRIDGGSQKPDSTTHDHHAEDGHHEEDHTKATVKLEEMLLVYPSSITSSTDTLRTEFVNTMLRSKSKAERDAVIATGLLPVSAAIDLLATLVWPFGGLLEIDAVWAYASIRGAKTSRSVTKRLTSTAVSGKPDEDTLHLAFTASPRLLVLEKYLAARCHERDRTLFPAVGGVPTETEVLEALGWTPSSKGGADRNWEDEQWEITEVKDDLKEVMGKGGREWAKWCKLYAKEPEKALKK